MDTKMTREQAHKVLSHYKPTSTISRVYDYGFVSVALITLIHNFEYPDWSHRTIGDAIAFIKEDSRFLRFRKTNHG